MPTIQDWFNVYAGIRDAVNGLKADLAAVRASMDGIKSSLTTDQGTHLDRVADDIHALSQTITRLEKQLTADGNLDSPTIADQILNISHFIEHNIAPNLSEISDTLTGGEGSLHRLINDKLTELSTAVTGGNPLTNEASEQLALFFSEFNAAASPGGAQALKNYLIALVKVFVDPIGWMELTALNMADSAKTGKLKDLELALGQLIQKTTDLGEPVLDALATPFRVVTEDALRRFRAALQANAPADPSKVTHVAAQALTEAYQFGQRAHFMAVLASVFPWLRAIGLPQMAAALGDLSGFRTVSQLIATSMLGASITRPSRWANNDIFAPEVLAIRDLYSLAHQRVIVIPRFVRGLQQQGFNDESVDALVRGIWRQPSIRDLALAIEDTTVADDWLLERVRKAGYEDSDAEQLTRSLTQRALKSVRGRVISAALANVTDGLLDTESYRTILERLQLRQDEIELQIQTAELTARRDTVNTAISTYRRQYVNDVIPRGDFTLALTALGVNPDRVDLIALDADAQRQPRIAREEEAKIKEAVREIQTELVPRYRRLYELGVIGDDAYNSILIEAGVSPQVAAQAVILDSQKRRIVTSTAAATALERETAKLVSETEEALKLQFRKGLLDKGQLKNSLEDLGYSDELVGVIVNQERARVALPPGRAIEPPEEAKARVLRDLAIQTALNDFRQGRTDALDLYDALVEQGMDADEAIARVNLEISRLPVPAT